MNRVPLKLIGISIPPSINLNVETLDLDCVYINKTYNYEVVAINKGTNKTKSSVRAYICVTVSGTLMKGVMVYVVTVQSLRHNTCSQR